MDKKTLEHIEGAAALNRLHHADNRKCLCVLRAVLALSAVAFLNSLWANHSNNKLHQRIVEQQKTIATQTETIANFHTNNALASR
jgi:hypothetical protein